MLENVANQRPGDPPRRRADDIDPPPGRPATKRRHGEHPEPIKHEPGQEPPRVGPTDPPDRP
jgi:hypothetical protein